MIALAPPMIICSPVATLDRGIHVTVEWTKPENDGGAKIFGYVIKYGDRDRDVDKYDQLFVDKNSTIFQFTHQLEERTSYRFAVAAVNAAGLGDFSEFSHYVDTWPGKYVALLQFACGELHTDSA